MQFERHLLSRTFWSSTLTSIEKYKMFRELECLGRLGIYLSSSKTRWARKTLITTFSLYCLSHGWCGDGAGKMADGYNKNIVFDTSIHPIVNQPFLHVYSAANSGMVGIFRCCRTC